jgi:PIN domain nuclease of toxin-antitoxin system
MKLLLDTHTFIWWDSSPAKLSQRALTLCTDPTNEIVLSVASIWEMQIKLQLGKLTLNMPLREILDNQQRLNSLQILPITINHVLALDSLPTHHKDPFDRLLIAQANVEDAWLISRDPIFAKYSVKLDW